MCACACVSACVLVRVRVRVRVCQHEHIGTQTHAHDHSRYGVQSKGSRQTQQALASAKGTAATTVMEHSHQAAKREYSVSIVGILAACGATAAV